MPLAFSTLNRGTIPFGFFNVKTDMVLLAEYFVFAGDLCGWIADLAAEQGDFVVTQPAWVIQDRAAYGNLHGAMAGVDLSGLIGAVYVLHPFPERDEDFHQDPQGWCIRAEIEPIADRFARRGKLVLRGSRADDVIDVGGYRFDVPGFAELVLYLWRGGAPHWAAGRRPDYVHLMMEAVRDSASWVFQGTRWPPQG